MTEPGAGFGSAAGSRLRNEASAADPLLPKIVTILREGYGPALLKSDVAAALTVAVVALPLSMAIAVGSGVTPERGLYASIVGGFVVSAFSGSRHQIGGPAGAFIVLVAATVARFGVEGLLVTVLMSGVLLALLGVLRLGHLIRHMPHAVTVGFTCGIAVTIAASQLKDLAGLSLTAPEPGPLLPKLVALAGALPSLNPSALGLGAAVVALIAVLKRWRPTWPAMLIAVTAAALAAALVHLPVGTIRSRFGDLPGGLPWPRVPPLSPALVLRLLPTALSFTLLGAVESLLSAKVADGMTGRRHRSSMELVAQGLANIASALFGGISVTGTIARTGTNIRAGGRSPVAGMLHSAFLLVFMAGAAQVVSFAPLCSLAGVLVTVCWGMAERAEFVRLMRTDWRGACVLVATFALTLLRDLTTGIIAGCVLAAVLSLVTRRPIAEEGE